MKKPVALPKIQTGDQDLQLIQDNVQKALAQLQAPGGMPYAPGDASKWVSPAPDTMQAALDRLAVSVAALRGSPIP